MKFRALSIALGALAITVGGQNALACGPDTNCVISGEEIGGDRHYRIRMPVGHDGKSPVGAIIYAHGYKGTAAGAMRNKSMGKAVSDLGLALIAVKSGSDDWNIPNAPHEPKPDQQKEMAYFDAVVADAAKRFGIDTSRIMVTGFSAGGQVTWTLACERGEKYAGFAPMAGTFWEPTPTTCPTPANHVLHVHGTSDRVVPLAGRPIRRTHQGNVSNVMAMYAKHGGFSSGNSYKALDLDCSRATNGAGKVLEICLHDGGHEFKTQYLVRAWKELEALGAVN